MRYLADIAKKDVSLAKAVAGLPWMKIELSEEERQGLNELSKFLVQDAALAKQVAAMPFITTSFEAHDRDALSALLYLGVNYPATLSLITAQSWFIDGLDDQEAAFVTVIGTPQGRFFGPDDLQILIQSYRGESRTATFPRAGEVQLTLFQPDPDFQSDPKLTSKEKADKLQAALRVVDQLEDAIRVSEDLMGVPFPKRDVFGRPCLDDASVPHDADAVANFEGLKQVVGDKNDGLV